MKKVKHKNHHYKNPKRMFTVVDIVRFNFMLTDKNNLQAAVCAETILKLCETKYTRMDTPARLVEALNTITLADQSIIPFIEDPMSVTDSTVLH